MIRTVGELIKVLQEYPEQLTLRIAAAHPRFPNNMSAVDSLEMNTEYTCNPEGNFPILVIKPLEF